MIRIRRALSVLAWISLSAFSQPPLPVLSPSEAIVLSQEPSNHGRSGRFEMTVRAAERTKDATFLNSTADYRAPDNVTFRLAPRVATALGKRLGAAVETHLIGKRIVLYGRIQRVPIYNTSKRDVTSFNRIQHMVYVDGSKQIISVGEPS